MFPACTFKNCINCAPTQNQSSIHFNHSIDQESNMKSFLVVFALIAVASAGSYSYVKRTDGKESYGYESSGIESVAAQGGVESYNSDQKDFHAYPKYKFEYGVKDLKTGDHKSQWEIRDGDVVKGEYTLDEADGTKRIVEYHADGKSGFHAKVKKIGHAHHNIGYGQSGFQ